MGIKPIAFLLVLSLASSLRADAIMNLSVDESAMEMTIVYNWQTVPDFTTVDSMGRTLDGFALVFYPVPSVNFLMIHLQMLNPEGLIAYQQFDGTAFTTFDPIPFTVDGTKVRFTVPLEGFTQTGNFHFIFGALSSGGVDPPGTAATVLDFTPVPLPPAVLGGAALLGVAGMRRWRRV